MCYKKALLKMLKGNQLFESVFLIEFEALRLTNYRFIVDCSKEKSSSRYFPGALISNMVIKESHTLVVALTFARFRSNSLTICI